MGEIIPGRCLAVSTCDGGPCGATPVGPGSVVVGPGLGFVESEGMTIPLASDCRCPRLLRELAVAQRGRSCSLVVLTKSSCVMSNGCIQ